MLSRSVDKFHREFSEYFNAANLFFSKRRQIAVGSDFLFKEKVSPFRQAVGHTPQILLSNLVVLIRTTHTSGETFIRMFLGQNSANAKARRVYFNAWLKIRVEEFDNRFAIQSIP